MIRLLRRLSLPLILLLPIAAHADGGDPSAVHACVKGNSITISSPAGTCPTGWTPAHLAFHFEVTHERVDGFEVVDAFCAVDDVVLGCNCKGYSDPYSSPIIAGCYQVSDAAGTPASASAPAIGCRGELSTSLAITVVATCMHRVQ